MSTPAPRAPRPTRAKPPPQPPLPEHHPPPGMRPRHQPPTAPRAGKPPSPQLPLDLTRVFAYREHRCLQAPPTRPSPRSAKTPGRAAASSGPVHRVAAHQHQQAKPPTRATRSSPMTPTPASSPHGATLNISSARKQAPPTSPLPAAGPPVKTDQGELAPASLTTMDSPNQVIEVGLATANAPGYTASRPRKRTEHPLRCCRSAPS